MSKTLTYGGTLTPTSCWCGIGLAIPSQLYAAAAKSGKDIHCPLGHVFVYRDGENDRLRAELNRAKDTLARERSRADAAEASRRAWKGQTTRLRNRAAEGQCIYCGKFFAALGVHVARQHPDEHPRDLDEADA